MVDQLVGCQGEKIPKHDLDHRAQAAQGHAGSHAGDAGLGDGGGEHPPRVSTRQAAGDLESATVRVEHIFAQQVDARVVCKSPLQGQVQFFQDRAHAPGLR